VFVNKTAFPDYLISVMVNEEDHIRAQCIHDGLSLNYALGYLNAVDDLIIRGVDVAVSPDYGFLTGCLTNAGTGLRASVMVFLPALCVIGGAAALAERKSMRDITIRGAYGEGSEATSYLFQISNRITMGKTESELIHGVYRAIEDVAYLEAAARDRLLKSGEVRSAVTNSYRALTSRNPLGLNEFITHFSNFKLGVGLGYYDVNNLIRLNKLIDEMQTATLIVKYNLRPENVLTERGKRVDEEITRLTVD
jgi:protein arginine kinase